MARWQGVQARRGVGSSSKLKEGVVRWLWQGQRWREPVHTTDGLPVGVIDPGQPAANVGPDYRGATITLGDVTVLGDVELHLRSSDWRRHGHGDDDAYNAVVLQVVLWDDALQPSKRLDGEQVPLLALAAYLEGSPERLLPLANGGHSCTACARAVREGGDEAALALLVALGLERLQMKADAFAGEIRRLGAEQALYQALLQAVALPEKGDGPRQVAASLPFVHLEAKPRSTWAGAVEAAWTRWVAPRRGYRPASAPGLRLKALVTLLQSWSGDLA
jgi:hypothetical protein